MNARAVLDEPVIVGAEIAAGHDGAAELVVRLRHPNGVEAAVVLGGEHGLQLMKSCGVANADELAGHSWRNILGGDG